MIRNSPGASLPAATLPRRLAMAAAPDGSQGNLGNILWLSAALLGVCVFSVADTAWWAWAGLFLLGCQTPASAMFLLCVTQLVTAPPGSVLTLTQLFGVVWAVRNILYFVTGRVVFELKVASLFLLPLVVWSLLTGAANASLEFTVCLLMVFCTSVIGIAEFRRTRNAWLVAFAVALACVLVAIPYWLARAGIELPPTSALSAERGVHIVRGATERFAGGTLDYNYAGACINIGIAGFLHLLLFSAGAGGSALQRLVRWCLVVPVALAVPAVLATLSRAASLGLVVAVVVPGAVHLLGMRSRSMTPRLSVVLANIFGLLLVGALIIAFGGSDVTTYWSALKEYQAGQTFLEGRQEVFSKALTAIGHGPILGDFSGLGAHNIFLDAACYAGIPGLLCFVILICYPMISLARRGAAREMEPFFTLFLVAFFGSLSLSLLRFKILWVVWGLVVAYCWSGSSQSMRSWWDKRSLLRLPMPSPRRKRLPDSL